MTSQKLWAVTLHKKQVPWNINPVSSQSKAFMFFALWSYTGILRFRNESRFSAHEGSTNHLNGYQSTLAVWCRTEIPAIAWNQKEYLPPPHYYSHLFFEGMRGNPAQWKYIQHMSTLYEQNTNNSGTKINNKWDFKKLKRFYKAKDTVNRTKQLPKEWRKDFYQLLPIEG